MQANLTRLSDLTAELRRQLKPLGRQAEIARRAAGVQADLRDSRLRLLADDLATNTSALQAEVADEQVIRAQRGAVERSLAQAREREAALEAAVAADAPALARTQEIWYQLSALDERFRGTALLAAERTRHLSADTSDVRSGRDPDAMEADAAKVRAEEATLRARLEQSQALLQDAVASRQLRERQLADAERELLAAARAVADRREGLAKLAGQRDALRSGAAAAGDEIARLSVAAAGARERSAQARLELDRAQAEVGLLDEGEVSLDDCHEAAITAHEVVLARVRDLAVAEREAERTRELECAPRSAGDGTYPQGRRRALLAAGSRLPGVLGSVAALLSVDSGHEVALAAALGPLADAVAVASTEDATAALELLKADDAGRAGLLAGGAGAQIDRSDWPGLPSGAVWALDSVRCPAPLRGAVQTLLEKVPVVEDLGAAGRFVRDHPSLRAVTMAGDVLGAGWAVGGSASAPSAIEIQAAVEEAQHRADEASTAHERLHAELRAAAEESEALAADVKATLGALNESDAKLSALAERLAELGQAARSAAAEAERLENARAEAEQARDRDLTGLCELDARMASAQDDHVESTEPATEQRDALNADVAAARQTEVDARLAVRTGEERVRALAGRADELMRAAEKERAARVRQQQERVARARGAVVAGAVRDAAERALVRIAVSVARAAQERDALQQARVVREAELLALRGRSRELEERLTRLTDAVHRDEIARAEQRLRIEALQTRAAEEFGVGIEELLAEYGPDQPTPPSSFEVAEYEQARERGQQVVAPQPGPYHRPTQEKRAARAERDLALLGKVNPLALEEFAALEERHRFLSAQLEDLAATRRDLLTVVREVDERILEVFTSAYHDVAREFEIVFATLFPGGEGRLALTDPDDMLMTGIDVEARPPGKKVKRLSLLSGGERSLTAVALLVAIFRARPSPFYILDEVEAALDDVNLGRLIELIDQLRATSQLIVITHQKRTMEIADALYGVTMRGDGITEVISQRLREAAV